MPELFVLIKNWRSTWKRIYLWGNPVSLWKSLKIFVDGEHTEKEVSYMLTLYFLFPHFWPLLESRHWVQGPLIWPSTGVFWNGYFHRVPQRRGLQQPLLSTPEANPSGRAVCAAPLPSLFYCHDFLCLVMQCGHFSDVCMLNYGSLLFFLVIKTCAGRCGV